MSDLSTRNWHSWIVVALGGWLVVSPLVLQQMTPGGAWAVSGVLVPPFGSGAEV
jgi:hypothetical protein